uniref:LAGLIDADG endonuclease n=1 Tax=Spizellomyces sp. 'palustris' TaxID=117820 RepID=UPI0010FBEEDF|nr:LAGLIDADG endonuclease [Spizellomyces sp. 'palustris']QCQ69053.1 LAGLIDADG endonuclease [Spizellomyces sp. 'palustris']
MFIYNLFSGFCTPDFEIAWKMSVSKIRGDLLYSCGYTTMQLPCFNEFHSLFYRWNGSKYVRSVPANIIELLTPLAIAIWIMDDGEFYSGLRFNTYRFYDQDIALLMEALSTKFGLTCSIHSHPAGSRIYIDSKSLIKIRPQLLPHMVPSMYYKVGL